jgi:hypothetical protein
MTLSSPGGEGALAGPVLAPGPGLDHAPPLAVQVPWLVRRLFPALATVGLIVAGMVSTIWIGPGLVGRHHWSLPDDLWGTLVAAQRLAHLDLGGLYARPTGLVGFPGAAVILVPVAVVIGAAGLSLRVPGVHNPHPAAWLVAGPYEIALSAVALFAADAIAERLGVSRPKRALLAAVGAVALWNVSARWGHPEDAVAVGLLLLAILALADGRTGRSGWLLGAAVAVQPLVLLALPVVAATVAPRRLPGFLGRAVLPGAVLLAAAATANWPATATAVTQQPNWPAIDHPTPWTSLAPHLSGGAVAGGPGRILAIAVACGCALATGRRWRTARLEAWPSAERQARPSAEGPARPGGRRPAWHGGDRRNGWSPDLLAELLWWVALALALRSVFESVMVAYYLWPVLAVALIAASRDWVRLAATSAAVVTLTFVSQEPWRSPWAWWAPMVAGLALTLFLARLPLRGKPQPA